MKAVFICGIDSFKTIFFNILHKTARSSLKNEGLWLILMPHESLILFVACIHCPKMWGEFRLPDIMDCVITVEHETLLVLLVIVQAKRLFGLPVTHAYGWLGSQIFSLHSTSLCTLNIVLVCFVVVLQNYGVFIDVCEIFFRGLRSCLSTIETIKLPHCQ